MYIRRGYEYQLISFRKKLSTYPLFSYAHFFLFDFVDVHIQKGLNILKKEKAAIYSLIPNKLKEAIKNYAKRATKNPNSSEVVLGKFNQDNISYIEVAQKRNATYFQLDDWDNVANTIGENNIWKVNELFIQAQLLKSKNFILSHNPFLATGYYKKEIEYLTKQGYQFTQNGDIWKALK